MINLYQKSLLRLFDITKQEINYLINFSKILKKNKKNKTEQQYLKKKNIVLIFEKESTRTRCAFEVAAFDQGANITYLGPKDTHLGSKESIKDTSQVLSSMYDGIQYRGHNHQNIEILSKYSKKPVWNGLTEKFHPTQLLADLLTIEENINKKKDLSEITLSYVGDASNNICNSILEAAALIGFNFKIVAPKKYWPEKKFFDICQNKIEKHKKKIICTENIQEGVKNTDFIYTDVWISMGEQKKKWEEKIFFLKKYQVNEYMLNLTNNPEIKILHCLPALHNSETKIGKEILNISGLKDGLEITNTVFKLNNNIIFQQAENRLHTIKALIISTLIM
ncbi:Ornithine carbamoyltransferase subunit I [Buchnera aphidicola (Eriosoma grossulariae)]|uniref:ornithine carbamoyltransferase n=1 Tax=Buchnera aphidicola TaxID=9 RepID=UPI003464A35D